MKGLMCKMSSLVGRASHQPKVSVFVYLGMRLNDKLSHTLHV